MKRIVVFVILVFSAVGLSFAQSSDWNVRRQQPGDMVFIIPGPSRRIINGELGISRGMVTLTDKNGVAWYVLGLDRFIGFIDGLDLGEEVELEGYAPTAPGSSQERFFQATKLILDDMDYDLVPLPEGTQVTVRSRTAQLPKEPVPWEPIPIPAPGTKNSQVIIQKNSQISTVQPRREPAPPQQKAQEHRHNSPWAPNNDPKWMQDLDLNAIWNENSNFWQDTANSRNNFFN
ncbi:hypothetical protein AGMMS49579_22340 [Spirochaetia bacterium]|nr:hypothetical protein AGMMS49579_22340 [Spirochaetia bacterium]